MFFIQTSGYGNCDKGENYLSLASRIAKVLFLFDIPNSAIFKQQKSVSCGVQDMLVALGALALSKRCCRHCADFSLVAQVAGILLSWLTWWLTIWVFVADLRIQADHKIENY